MYWHTLTKNHMFILELKRNKKIAVSWTFFFSSKIVCFGKWFTRKGQTITSITWAILNVTKFNVFYMRMWRKISSHFCFRWWWWWWALSGSIDLNKWWLWDRRPCDCNILCLWISILIGNIYLFVWSYMNYFLSRHMRYKHHNTLWAF